MISPQLQKKNTLFSYYTQQHILLQAVRTMAAAAAFPFFSRLPAELRNQIWRDALPDKVDQALYFYKKGCWDPRRLTEADEGYSPEDDELNLKLEFFHSRLDHVQFEIPLFFVNREARGIALSWIEKQGLKIYFHKGKETFYFTRPFNPEHDTLYIPFDRWEQFLDEPTNRLCEPDLVERNVSCEGTACTRIAVPEVLLWDDGEEALLDIFDYYPNAEKIFIIFKAQPDPLPEDDGGGGELKVQRRWEFESIQGAIFWDAYRCEFEWQSDAGDCINGNHGLSRLVKDDNNGFSREVKERQPESFEVRPGFAIMK